MIASLLRQHLNQLGTSTGSDLFKGLYNGTITNEEFYEMASVDPNRSISERVLAAGNYNHITNRK